MTVTTLAPRELVVGPGRVPAPYGLFSAVTFRESSGGRWEANGATWEPFSCAPLDAFGAVNCAAPADTPGYPKPLGSPASVEGFDAAVLGKGVGDWDDAVASVIGVLATYSCGPAAAVTAAVARSRAEERLRLLEERAVENAFWTGAVGNVPNLVGANGFEDPEQVTTGAVNPVVALGRLEHALGDGYGLTGVIHMTRTVATYLITEGAVTASGGRLVTALGTPVVAGSGYPGGATAVTAEAATSWLVATPAVVAYRSEVFSADPAAALDPATNTRLATAERLYLIGVEPCGMYAAEAALTD